MFQIEDVEKLETNVLCLLTFFENLALHEIMWKNIVERGRSQMTKWRMRIACWTPRATNTHSEYVNVLLFHGNNGCTNAPQCYVIRVYIACLITSRTRFTGPPSKKKGCYTDLDWTLHNTGIQAQHRNVYKITHNSNARFDTFFFFSHY
jgi:hypothetical protein